MVYVDALRAVKKALVDPKHYLENWSKGDPCISNWTGVWCYDTVGFDGFYHVRELQLLNMNLSGTLAPELGKLSHLEVLDFMWNQINGSIPKEIGNLSSLKILVLNGNLLSGSLPYELGFLSNMSRLQLDQNNLSGTIPKTFANMKNMEHFHLDNNSFSGQLPSELSQLKNLVHLLLDNNNFSGNLPSQFYALSKLEILQLDNNHFDGAEIPESYQNLSSLVKLSLRNCSLGGTLPDFSQMPFITYIDMSWNMLTGSIPSNKLSANITTIDLSNNKLDGLIPESFSYLPSLQMLSLANNSLNGSVPASIWHNKSLSGNARLSIDLQYNLLSDISGDLNSPQNVNIRLQGNPLCNNAKIRKIRHFCDSNGGGNWTNDGSTYPVDCPATACPLDQYYELIPQAPTCFCAVPIRIGYRLKSPSFTYFPPYISDFESYVTSALNMELYQIFIDSYAWEEGPRLRMDLKIFPNTFNNSHSFNESEVHRIRHMYTTWQFPRSELFGPYELLNFTLLGPYISVNTGKGGISKVLLVSILVGVVVCAVVVSVAITLFISRKKNSYRRLSRRFLSKHMSIKIAGIKDFTYNEMSQASNDFDCSAQVGEGGYGNVYKGTLADGTVVAIKRAKEDSRQGMHEFLTEIHLLSRLHHRNLVALVGYCCENDEQMLVYEFMPNGTLEDWLSGKSEKILGYSTRLHIALGAASGVLYLHREANPPIFHRDIKASNILLDSHLIAKVADFGISCLAPVLDDEGDTSQYLFTGVKGTPGYIDPEYFLTQNLTDKSDVYSLGVVFLELITGVPPISHGKNLVREVNLALKSGPLLDIVDKRMKGYSCDNVERFIALTMRCCEEKPEMRPSMLDVVRELENILKIDPESTIMSDSISLQSTCTSTTQSTCRPDTILKTVSDIRVLKSQNFRHGSDTV
ncbi:putative LRR receptor-like serine/threonine-protein kinase At1g06840 isoform X2 [Silene latifolia]|uniref:putative LRR receptor-like serine/threonine-protein kinase At1g06840 isoform X2 n=1 Tax=Silene latifolia TaxID=37657 RepID=UPI003D76DC6E